MVLGLKSKQKKMIGRIERVDFPELGLFAVEAKVDTGAYSSALHCHDIVEDEEQKKLTFKLLDPDHPNYNEQIIITKHYSSTVVKSSIGKKQKRYKIKTFITLGKKNYKTDFTLTDRSAMRYPVLLGRKVLSGRFLVDVKSKYILNKI